MGLRELSASLGHSTEHGICQPGVHAWRHGPILVLVLPFSCWRVTRGGRVSRGVLIFASVEMILSGAQLTQRWHGQALAVFAISLAALMLLLSPAVYARTHPGAVAASPGIRLRPSRWLVLSAPLAGAAVAGLTLAVTRRWLASGSRCMIGPVEGLPQRCTGMGRGFPVPVVATVHGHHTASPLAFAQDSLQWTVFIFAVSYLVWLAVHRRQPPVPERPAAAGIVAKPSLLPASPNDDQACGGVEATALPAVSRSHAASSSGRGSRPDDHA